MAKKKRKPDKNKSKVSQTHSVKSNYEISYQDLIRKKFKERIRYVKSKNIPDPEVYDGLDYDASYQKRRMLAITRLLDSVRVQTEGICEDIPEVFSLKEEWADINTFPIPAYDFEERFTYSIVAASIWILDQIKEANRTSELMCLLAPSDEKVLFDVPPIWDPCHSNDVIYSMVEALYYRNDPEDRRAFWPGEIRRPYMNPEITADKLDQTWERRSNMNAILHLIPQEAIDRAVMNYTERYWDFTRRYFRSRMILAKEANQINEDSDAFSSRLESIKESLVQANGSKNMVHAAYPSVLSQSLPVPGADFQKLSDDLMLSPKIASITRMCAENDQLNKREEALAEKVEMLWHRCGLLTQWPVHRIEDTFGAEIANIWAEFDAGDPYEMCFALMYLIDTGSDLPWCYFPGVNLHTAVSALLPWPRTRYNIEADGIWRHYDPETGERLMGPDPTPLPKRIRIPELESWYQLKYRDSGDADELYNLGQVIYEATGCIMPRKLDRYQPALSTLDRYGISGKKAVHPLLYCMTLLGEGKQQTKPSYASIGFVDDEKNEDSDAANASIEELRSEVQSLRNEVKMLRRQSYEYSREVRDEKIRCETMAQKAANDAQELHDLRELIFNQQNAVYDEPDTKTDIVFPYRTTRKIVVFGGHDSWAREMKPKFPDIRFIDRDMMPNPDLIRHADTIWIQTNALAHKHFYIIIDEVRKYGIPLRYFTYSGVLKCAEQIVNDDVSRM